MSTVAGIVRFGHGGSRTAITTTGMGMTPLGALDALFLHLETPATPMHVGALNLLQVDARPDDLYSAISGHISARLSSSAVFTRRLLPVPLAAANPVWIDAGPIDLAYHVRRLRLPAPGTRAQLTDAVAKLHAQRLDRRRPLWQFWLIEGLTDGDFGWYSKVHHAAVDGAAGVAMAQALLDTLARVPRTDRPPERRPPAAEAPGLARLLGTVLAHNARAGLSLIRHLPALAAVAGSLLRSTRGDVLRQWARQFSFAPPTVFNRVIDSGRSVATFSAPLGSVQAIAAAHAATVNDVVLALVAGALRRLLAARGELPGAPLLAAMPVSLRAGGDLQMNTQASMMQANLATDIADPIERLRRIHGAAAAAKAMSRELRPAPGLSLPSLGLPWLLTTAAALYGTPAVGHRLPKLANVVVSNVPGPPVPLYLAGARLRGYWPLSIVAHGLGLNVTVMRYVDSLDFGLVAARRLLPDLAPLAQAMRDSLAELDSATFPPSASAGRKRATAESTGATVVKPGRGRAAAAGGRRSLSARKPRSVSRGTR